MLDLVQTDVMWSVATIGEVEALERIVNYGAKGGRIHEVGFRRVVVESADVLQVELQWAADEMINGTGREHTDPLETRVVTVSGLADLVVGVEIRFGFERLMHSDLVGLSRGLLERNLVIYDVGAVDFVQLLDET